MPGLSRRKPVAPFLRDNCTAEVMAREIQRLSICRLVQANMDASQRSGENAPAVSIEFAQSRYWRIGDMRTAAIRLGDAELAAES